MAINPLSADVTPINTKAAILQLSSELDDLSARLGEAANLMWMASGNTHNTPAQEGAFRALEMLTKGFADEAEAMAQRLMAATNGATT
jgi:hypothetical protein